MKERYFFVGYSCPTVYNNNQHMRSMALAVTQSWFPSCIEFADLVRHYDGDAQGEVIITSLFEFASEQDFNDFSKSI